MGKSTNSHIYYEKMRKRRLAEANVTEVKARTLSRAEIESLLKERYGKKLKPVVMKLSMRKHRIKSNFGDIAIAISAICRRDYGRRLETCRRKILI